MIIVLETSVQRNNDKTKEKCDDGNKQKQQCVYGVPC